MELPFAVESPPNVSDVQGSNNLGQSESSLVTASSQGSFMNSSQLLDGPLPPNTPHDVVLPHYENRQQQSRQQHTHPTSSHPSHPAILSGPIPSGQRGEQDEPEIIDFTYVNVSEVDADDDVGILLEGGDLDLQPETERGDILTVLLSGMQNQQANEAILTRTESANQAATKATQAKKSGDLMAALEYHSQAAKLYRDNAMAVRDQNASLATSLLLLSQIQAKSALSLKGIVKLSAAELQQIFPCSDLDSKSTTTSSATMTQKDRLRAAVRGALGSRHPHEEDISDSQFLGRATSDPDHGNYKAQNTASPPKTGDEPTSDDENGTLLWEGQDSNHNAVDEMMELERELRDMDMALELGNSISSLDARMQNRMKNSIVDGSFMVVPPGSNSYMSSSMWGNNPVPNTSRHVPHPPSNNTAGVRARANRVQTMLEASATPANRQVVYPPQVAPAPSKNSSGLESSWWGNASTTSQVLTSSVISIGGRLGDGNLGELHGGQPANTKQLMRLMDSLKTLGDENAALLREVEEAEAARLEAKAAREAMKKFREEYTNRLSKLKAALKKYAQEYPQNAASTGDHPVQTSEFHRSASTADQLQRQEQLIRKLTLDLKKEKEALKKEKEESRKKDQALRKYENFYREVKARSAQKAAQKTQQQRQHKSPRKTVAGAQR